MQACWREDPEQRPPFSEILPELQRIEHCAELHVFVPLCAPFFLLGLYVCILSLCECVLAYYSFACYFIAQEE